MTASDDYRKYFTEEIEFMQATDAPPAPPEYAVPGLIPMRQLTQLSGQGGIGKSLLTMQLAGATVLGGRTWIDDRKIERGPALVFGAEDTLEIMHSRIADVARHHGTTVSDLIQQGLHVVSYAGSDMTLARVDSDGDMEATKLYVSIWYRAQEIRPRIIVFDTRSDIFGGDENNRSQVSGFMNLMLQLALAVNCAIVINAHPSIAGSNSGTSGSTAWYGKFRANLHFRHASKDEGGGFDPDLLVLEATKNQYGALAPKVMLRFRDGVFVPASAGSDADPETTERLAEQVFLNLLDRFKSKGRSVCDKKGTTYAPALFAKEREAKSARLDNKALEEAMRRLFAAGKLQVITDGPKSRKRSRIST